MSPRWAEGLYDHLIFTSHGKIWGQGGTPVPEPWEEVLGRKHVAFDSWGAGVATVVRELSEQGAVGVNILLFIAERKGEGRES